MTDIRPFRGLRYNADKVVLDDVVSPPYDIIDVAQDGPLRARSPHNMIHLDLPRAEGGGDRYRHAAATGTDSQPHAEVRAAACSSRSGMS